MGFIWPIIIWGIMPIGIMAPSWFGGKFIIPAALPHANFRIREQHFRVLEWHLSTRIGSLQHSAEAVPTFYAKLYVLQPKRLSQDHPTRLTPATQARRVASGAQAGANKSHTQPGQQPQSENKVST